MIELVEGKNHIVIKRDGREEPYNEEKMRKVLYWAVSYKTGIEKEEAKEALINDILESVSIKIHNKIHITRLFDEVINTCSNKISDLSPVMDKVARNLYIQKIYKEIWGSKRGEYPSFNDYYEKVKKVYDPKIFEIIDEDEFREYYEYLKPERDFNFSFGGLNLFMDKYSGKYKRKPFELPQHTYLRVAISLFLNEKDKDLRKRLIKEKYDYLSEHFITEATPKVINSGFENSQYFSCVLARPDDDTASINITAHYLGVLSKFGGGLAIDVSSIRAVGSEIKGNRGVSGGVIPFLKEFEAVVSAYNQGSARRGACAVYYNWWHYESPSITMANDAGGKDEDRARKLKYAVKWHRLLTEKIKKKEEIYLFDPVDVTDMIDAYGDELKELYEKYSNKYVRKKKIHSSELAFTIAKAKVETGNNYTFFVDNANDQRMTKGLVTQSNLCTEYMPTFEKITVEKEKLICDCDDNDVYGLIKTRGDIALCNLSSINLMKWYYLNDTEKLKFMYNLLRSMDNAIEISFYPAKLGEKHSKRYRNVGVGVSNYAQLLAHLKIHWNDKEAEDITHQVFEEIAWYGIYVSTQLAKERGRYYYFEEDRWSEAILPFEISILEKTNSHLNKEYKMDWDLVKKRIKDYGVRFSYIFAIAPTQTSGLTIGATEGIEPIRKYFNIQEGTFTLPFVAPNILKNREYYDICWDVPNERIIELAAIRQKFIDMGQSMNLYYKEPKSAGEVIEDIMYAEKLGLKSIYYTTTPKSGDIEECFSCAS